jgi:hypothetical protein
MSQKLTVVTKDLEIVYIGDDYDAAIKAYKAYNELGIIKVFCLTRPDREKRIKVQKVEPPAAAKSKK